jgi:hypothetical protein
MTTTTRNIKTGHTEIVRTWLVVVAATQYGSENGGQYRNCLRLAASFGNQNGVTTKYSLLLVPSIGLVVCVSLFCINYLPQFIFTASTGLIVANCFRCKHFYFF